uniref:Uncharacterized protein n=1 Tax=Oryza sativa subsp. japonica TaxID=39947 RepID=Q688N6_ORYSJ|nr:unknown protein [Oryza sativa Japonica Group]
MAAPVASASASCFAPRATMAAAGPTAGREGCRRRGVARRGGFGASWREAAAAEEEEEEERGGGYWTRSLRLCRFWDSTPRPPTPPRSSRRPSAPG